MKITKYFFRNLALLLFLAFGLSSFAQNNMETRDKINSANQQFIKIFSESGGYGVGALYAKDAMVMPPNSDFIKSDAIGSFWKGAFDAGVKKLNLETVDVESSGKMATETGKFTLYDANDKVLDFGKYLVLWKNEDGKWKLFRDIWNSSSPGK